MTPALRKGIVVAAIHVAIVGSLGAKLLVDRATRPRVWARTTPIDPNLPIRGRYLRLGIEAVPGPGVEPGKNQTDANHPDEFYLNVALSERDGRLVATPADDRRQFAHVVHRDGERIVRLWEPVAFFIPEHVQDASRRQPGEELWVEVTIPRAGPPRPIRLGVKKDGVLTPLHD
jgi:hypothetical protein